MKKLICALIIVALIVLAAMPVLAQLAEDPRLAELRQQFAMLSKQKLEVETQMIRLEGMFIERQRIIMEETAGIEGEEEEEAEEVEEAVEETVEE